MKDAVWEDFISLNGRSDFYRESIDAAASYLNLDDGTVVWDKNRIPLDYALAKDTSRLPTTEGREGYYGANHFNYWASGLRDYCEIKEWLELNNIETGTYLDFGCATGRVLRAFQAFSTMKVIGCDINRKHIDWISANLPSNILAFQNHSIPSLPLPDNSIDLVTAFSVFTHVENFDTTWLMEIRRILKPSGIAWLTIHGDRTWKELQHDWPLYAALSKHPDYQRIDTRAGIPPDRTVFRWRTDMSYTSNVFYEYSYIKGVWGRILDFVEIRPCIPRYQDVVILRKS